jgi:hypothetical protein
MCGVPQQLLAKDTVVYRWNYYWKKIAVGPTMLHPHLDLFSDLG